jgi:hypothetical protein
MPAQPPQPAALPAEEGLVGQGEKFALTFLLVCLALLALLTLADTVGGLFR